MNDVIYVGSSEKASESIQRNELHRVMLFLQNFYTNEIEKFEKAQIFLFPFFIDTNLLNDINEEICKQLKILQGDIIEFSSNTRYKDLTSKKINSFETFVNKAGNKKRPEKVYLEWKKFHLDNNGNVSSGKISITFETEQKLNNQYSPIGDWNYSYIDFNVSGSDLGWVESTFDEIQPYISVAKISGIYRPLWIFRNKHFTMFLSHILGWTGVSFGWLAYDLLIHSDRDDSIKGILQQIISNENIDEKINILSNQLLVPIKEVWWEPIVMLLFGAIGFCFFHWSGMNLLPLLTPKSHVAIGLTNRISITYYNTFKFVVFSLMILGIIIPVLLYFFLN